MFAAVLVADPGHATNGLNIIGFGLESHSMAGADLALARDPLALNTNPAGIAQLRGLHLEQQGTVVFPLGTGHADMFNPKKDVDNERAFAGNLGISQSIGDYPVTLGGGLFVVGGSGVAYEDLNTAFGTRDDLSTMFGIVRGALGAAARPTEKLSLGAAVAVSYALIDQKIFPNTSVFDAADPAHSFFGTEIRDAHAVNGGFRLGARYEVNDRLALAVAYGSKVELPVRGDDLTADLSALGLGQVTYRDVEIDGLAQAQELGLGAAYRLTERLLLAVDVTWLDWSGALQHSTLTATEPDDARAPSTLSSTTTLDWRDQYVIAVGAAFEADPSLILWAGYNYGRNPIPPQHMNPLLANTGEHHVTGGIAWQPWDGWRVGIGAEYQIPNEVTYTNPELPFGPGAQDTTQYVALFAGASLQW